MSDRQKSQMDHHADEDAEVEDERIVVEETGVGIDIIRERYHMVKYDEGERWYDWHEDESFHVRADHVADLTSGIQECDIEALLDSVRQLQDLDEALSQ